MAETYGLKQVQVRLKLSEAEPLYSTEQITTPDKAVEVMARALAQLDREYCCVVNLDGANHPVNFNIVSIGDVNQAQVPIQNVFKSAILSNAASIMLFHNHPSGALEASRADIDITKRLVEAGRLMNIPVLDHIIVAGGAMQGGLPKWFSFRGNNPQMFEEKTANAVFEADTLNEPQPKENRFAPPDPDRFAIYQLKDDESLHDIRFEGLERLQKRNLEVDGNNYNMVYEAALKPGVTLDDIYYQFNMQRPLDFRGHSLSVSDVVVLHQNDLATGEKTDRAFYVDSFGFTELPGFLKEKSVQLEEAAEAAYKLGDRYISIQRTEEGFDYSIYDEKYQLLDGGVYDSPDASIRGILEEITEELKRPFYDTQSDTYSHTALQGSIRQSDTAEAVDFEELME